MAPETRHAIRDRITEACAGSAAALKELRGNVTTRNQLSKKSSLIIASIAENRILSRKGRTLALLCVA